QLNSLQNTWPYGYSMPIAVRYTQDAFSRSGWLWPVDAKGEPLKATSYMAVGFYVAKYVNKKSDMVRLVAFLLFFNPQCLASISRWITASSSWKRFCLFVCRALSSIMVICMLTAIRLLLTFVMSLYLLLRS